MKSSELRFRAHRAGDLMTDKKGTITHKQKERYQYLHDRDYESTKNEAKPLTEKMKDEMNELRKKIKAPFELSDTAKQYVFEMWAENEKGIYTTFTSKYTEKGLWTEEECLSLLTEVDDRFYKKNDHRKTNEDWTGEVDIGIHNINGKKVIQDNKSSWDFNTFFNAQMTLQKEWQARVYMELWDADECWVRHCLVDCPEHIWQGELYRWKMNNNIIDEDLPEYKPFYDKFRATLFFSDNPTLTKEERVRTFKVERNKEAYNQLKERVGHARSYYDSISLKGLNQVF